MTALPARSRDSMHADGWRARVDLAACCRIFDVLEWTEMICNHITVRLPDAVPVGRKPPVDCGRALRAAHPHAYQQ